MVAELPPPPAPYIAQLEASFSPYEHLWAGEGETPPENPVRLAFGEPAIANPVRFLLDRLGTLFLKIRDRNVIQMPVTETSDGLGDGTDPVPPGDPIPVDGGGKPGG